MISSRLVSEEDDSMSIIPGTTPTLTFQLDTSILGSTAAEFCLVCDHVRILRSLSELMLSEDGTEVSIRLTQAETLSLPDNRIAKVQLRVILGGSVSATEVLPVPTKELLHREELTANAD